MLAGTQNTAHLLSQSIVDWLLERTVGTGMNGVSFGALDFANDVLLVELLVVPIDISLSVQGLANQRRRCRNHRPDITGCAVAQALC